jgi:phosphoribosylamine--glycine ligase
MEKKMRYLVVGSGGREHAIYWRLMSDGSASEVYVAPGNGGIDKNFRVNISATDFEGLYKFVKEKSIDMVVVGPEVPLVAGIVDFFIDRGVPCFGPKKAAAMIEGSKLFAKRIMEKYNVPTAKHYDFKGQSDLLDFLKKSHFPVVIKLDGLAAGKGVAIPENYEEAFSFVKENVGESTDVYIEEYLEGEEASVLGISDGTTVIPFIAAQDHKRVFDGDKGPNTGGMGAYAPAPVITSERMDFIQKEVMQPVIDGLRSEGAPFVGILYAGVMVTKNGIKVLEFNARFGDPETQVILPLLDVPLGTLFKAAIDGNLHKVSVRFKNEHAMTTVIASRGYPGSYEKNKVISGLNDVQDVMVFHAGTEEQNGQIVSSGGRVLNVTATGSSLKEAKEKIYSQIDKIKFDGAFYRRDIGYKAL